MRVSQSSISFSSGHLLRATSEKKEDLEFWDNRNAGATDDRTLLSREARELSKVSGEVSTSYDGIYIDKKYYILARLISALTGKDIKILVPRGTCGTAGSSAAAGQQTAEGWGLRYSALSTYTEEESTGFSATGTVTADGKEYSFSVKLLMERSFTTSERIDIRAGDALKDPLVVNLGVGPVDLSGQKIKFDIDLDGTDEEVPVPGTGSGFLSLDKNGNGIIDDGSELFGPATGDGYGELASYDEDRNGWIDEADSVYSRLRIWSREGESESLRSLADLQIGALYTGSASTPFEMKDDSNRTEAMVQKSSVYLREDGTAGTTQKIDLAL